MISTRGVMMVAVVGAMVVLAVGGAAYGQTHAPWPTNWNNWNDPALWVTVGNPGNAGQWSGEVHGGYGPDRVCGAVAYTFNIGKFEVTAGQYTAFLNAVAKTDTYGLYNINMDTAVGYRGCNIKRTGSSGSYAYSVASDWANRPVNCVSWGDAARFANWVTKGQPTGGQDLTTTEDGSYYLNGATSDADLQAVTRKAQWKYAITSEDEWFKAAYYKGGSANAGYWDYPTRSEFKPSNVASNPDPGCNANYFISATVTIGPPYNRTEVGEFENSGSPYGTFDQGGNVSEWTEAIPAGSTRGVRGGSFYSDEFENRTLNAFYRYSYIPTSEGYGIGFRLSEVPEPATLLLLAAGALALLCRKRASQCKR
ncbi:MAG: SUMF1/EgtB/PvdO family nonheme iron enzyme [Planctomycetota bacterium]|nr:SUMF1/EgtB/PvdO family nonheme iron enzyme [Planctomycetota bacterium]